MLCEARGVVSLGAHTTASAGKVLFIDKQNVAAVRAREYGLYDSGLYEKY